MTTAIDKPVFESGMLLQLADFLEQLPAEKFDYMQWGAGEVGEGGLFGEDCGMVCCAGGWACKLFPDQLELYHPESNGNDSTVVLRENPSYENIEALARCFRISFTEARAIFIPHNSCLVDDVEILAPKPHANPKEVASHIRDFVELKLLEIKHELSYS